MTCFGASASQACWPVVRRMRRRRCLMRRGSGPAMLPGCVGPSAVASPQPSQLWHRCMLMLSEGRLQAPARILSGGQACKLLLGLCVLVDHLCKLSDHGTDMARNMQCCKANSLLMIHCQRGPVKALSLSAAMKLSAPVTANSSLVCRG